MSVKDDWVDKGPGVPQEDYRYNAAAANAVADDLNAATAALEGTLSEIAALTPSAGDALVYDGDEWVAEDALPVNITSPANGHLLAYSAGQWVNVADDKQSTTGKNQANGYAGLDGNSRISAAQLPFTAMEYKGVWNASTNSPSLADGSGSVGDFYRVGTAGTRNLGSGSIEFAVTDYAIYNGTTWEKLDNTEAVSSVAGLTGVITASGLTDALTDGSTNHVFTAADDTKLGGVASGATANSSDATLLARANHTGTQSADTVTDGTTNKAYTATEKTKLAGIATSATANDTDANLKNRANHTGTQPVSSLTSVTADAAELNILDGALLSTTELNYVDGVTGPIQTQLDKVPRIIRKPSDTSITSDTTLAKDGAFDLAVLSGEQWILEYFIILGASNITADAKFAVVAPGSSVGWWAIDALTDASTSSTGQVRRLSSTSFNTGNSMAAATHTSALLVKIEASIQAGGNGTFELWWAQNVSDATATVVKVGSYLRATKIS